jgi:carbonic anhydrase
MRDVAELVSGYRRFQSDLNPPEADRYRSLAEDGQAPKKMEIACCDSRVDPAPIFSASPGELFVVRNVAHRSRT